MVLSSDSVRCLNTTSQSVFRSGILSSSSSRAADVIKSLIWSGDTVLDARWYTDLLFLINSCIRRLLPTLRRPYRTITCADASSYLLSRKPRSFSRSMNLVITVMIMQITTINCCDARRWHDLYALEVGCALSCCLLWHVSLVFRLLMAGTSSRKTSCCFVG